MKLAVNWLVVASSFIVLHQTDGREILVNTDYIVTLNHTEEVLTGKRNTAVAPGAKCVVFLSNTRYYGVKETCEQVRQKMEIELPRQPMP